MPLEEYSAKRRFENTPEPPPSLGSSPGGNYFCVQRHDATRLHYDFRLEIGGVLKSWAVPKGPTLDPAARHFAAHVEDHPLEYGSFEGNIPKGNYGAGSVMLWDRGWFELLGDAGGAEQMARGDLKFRLHGEKLNGDFALVLMRGRGKGNEWLIIKKRDAFATPGWDVESQAHSVLSGRTQEEIARNLPARKDKRKTAGPSDRVWESKPARRASAAAPAAAAPPARTRRKKPSFDIAALKGARKAEMPGVFEPMKATLAGQPPNGEDWLFEIKWDGVRALAYIDREELRLVLRSGQRSERQYPELAAIPHNVAAGQAILDGEIVALDPKGASRFHLIQPRIANTDPNAIAHLTRSAPVVYYAFDLLYAEGYDLRGAALADRRRALEALVTPDQTLRISAAFPGAGRDLLEAARAHELEGIVGKRAASVYESRRSREWVKVKIANEQEFAIGGFTEPQGNREFFGALVLGVYEEGELRWAGNVGTGFDAKLLAAIYARLKPLVTGACPFAERPKPDRGMTWVRPELACQVKYAEWTPDNRLRAPVFVGLREDVPGRHARRESAAIGTAEFLPPDAKESLREIDGHSLKFTNLPKLFYPDEGYAKRDVLNYYAAIAGLILPYLKDRPLSLKRYPDGIKKEYFFQKNVADKFPPWLRTQSIPSDHAGKPITFAFAQDRASLLYLVNLGCIDQNPWMSRAPALENPDFILIDLDPYECPFDKIVDAALLVKRTLDRIGLAGYPKTTGGDGMHIYIPVAPVYSYEQTRTFAELISRLAIAEQPDLFTTPRAVEKRKKGRVYFDYLQNGYSKTISAPYVLRAYPGAPVATPLEWSEVKHGLRPAQFHIGNARERFAEKGDVFAGVLENPQRMEDALARLEKLYR
ncbi:MAG TPA: DNA ligase D [Bryobacteraceae bacterium]|nr:DNA ligase D [Bryobacteraceae bacterium]